MRWFTTFLMMLLFAWSCGGSSTGGNCSPDEVSCPDGGVCVPVPGQDAYQCRDACDPLDPDACSDGYSCDRVSGQDFRTTCFAQAYLQGRVFDLSTGNGIANARVVALDPITATATASVETVATGHYEIPIRVTRTTKGEILSRNPDANGTLIDQTWSLIASAPAYLPYPSPITTSIPVTQPAQTAYSQKLSSPQTEIGLRKMSNPDASGSAIRGTLGVPVGGALVVAECQTPPCPHAYTDHQGNFTIFNVVAGNYEVVAYKKGLYLEPKSVTMASTDVTGVTLAASTFAGGTVTGSVNIVNAPGGAMTSIVLIPESTFHETLVHGVVGPGLRAPEPPAAPNVDGAYSITGVPAGDYVVLAAFENDGLVRDPDPTISGTQIVHFTISAAAPTAEIDAFKVTEALEIVSPGASEPEAIGQGAPTFRWKDDSSEDEYVLKVYDMFGDLVWEHSMEGVSTGADVSLMYAGTQALVPGMYYQWKVTSLKKDAPISTTEDLLGVFFIE